MLRLIIISCFAWIGLATNTLAQSLTEYRYWWDDDMSTLVTEDVSTGETLNLDTELATAMLNRGHHRLTVQVKDDNDTWSIPYTQVFYQNGDLVEYEYWFDDDLSSSTIVTTGATSLQDINTSLDVSSLSSGIHKITIRSLTNNGEGSVPVSRYFKISGGDLISWEYWFDDDVNTNIQQTLDPPQNMLDLMDNLDASGLNAGPHTVTWRAQDTSSNWSVPITYGFDVILNVEDIPGLESVMIFPTPTRDQLNIKAEMSTNINLQVEVLNQAGQIINIGQTGLSSANSTLSLDVTRLASGIYFVRLSNSEGFTTHKFVKL